MNEKIIQKIRKLMYFYGFNQKQLALKLNISEVTISRYLNGNRKLTIEFIYKVAHFFNISVDWLLNNE